MPADLTNRTQARTAPRCHADAPTGVAHAAAARRSPRRDSRRGRGPRRTDNQNAAAEPSATPRPPGSATWPAGRSDGPAIAALAPDVPGRRISTPQRRKWTSPTAKPAVPALAAARQPGPAAHRACGSTTPQKASSIRTVQSTGPWQQSVEPGPVATRSRTGEIGRVAATRGLGRPAPYELVVLPHRSRERAHATRA